MESDCEVLAVDSEVAEVAGKISAGVKDAGFSIGTPDSLIAATAITHDLMLVTHNRRDFARINGLRLDDWLTA
jgi:tRNA(fMet)-specific endonuclease VapC